MELVIDTDTAADDAVALVLAASTPGIRLAAVTTVAGNVPVDLATRNAAWALQVGGRDDVPLYSGAAGPLRRQLVTGQDVHGESGMGDARPPDGLRAADQGFAAQELVRAAIQRPGELTLVTLGPLTNIAIAVLLDPLFLTRFARVVVMGGAPDAHGNVTPVAEYNFWADPEAVDIVLRAAGELELVGWDVSRQAAVITDEEAALLAAKRTPKSRFVLEATAALDRYCRTEQGLAGFDLPDPVAVAVAMHPGIVTSAHRLPVSIMVEQEARGQLQVDRRGRPSGRWVRVIEGVDRQAFLNCLMDACELEGAAA
ncbi:nucleoside hydrolase [Kribbella sp. NPDC050124]|uniref:nucleoside hydrolase n=1 Tax=Kribbella sp. NPDC050124 TaxID=3364114 RepID=UPI00379659B8